VKIATELTGQVSKPTERSLNIGSTRQTECAWACAHESMRIVVQFAWRRSSLTRQDTIHLGCDGDDELYSGCHEVA